MRFAKSIAKKVLALCFVIAMVTGMCSTGVQAAEPKVKFEVAQVAADPGKRVDVAITMNTTNQSFLIAGLQLSITYDPEVLEYVSAEYDGSITLLTGAEVYNNKTAKKVTYGWYSTSGENVAIATAQKISTITFRVKDNVPAGKSQLSLKVEDAFYQSGKDFVDLSTGKSNGSVTVGGTVDAEVVNVNDLISKVATIYTIQDMYENGQGSQVKQSQFDSAIYEISRANRAYIKLLDTQKKQVTDYDRLKEAQVLYDNYLTIFKNKAVAAEVEAYIKAHERVLALTVDTVEGSDAEDLLAAKTAYEDTALQTKLSDGAKYALYKKYMHLLSLEKKIKLDVENAEAEAAKKKLIEEAKKFADAFWQDFTPATELVAEDITDEHYDYLLEAVTDIESKQEMNPFVLSAEGGDLQDVYDYLKTLLVIAADKAGVGLTDDQKAARTYLETFNYVLELTEKTVSANDLNHIEIALSCYGFLSEGAKAELEKTVPGVKALLETLLAKSESLQEEEEETAVEAEEGETVYVTETEYVYVDTDGDGVKEKIVIRYKNAGMDATQAINFRNRSLGVITLIAMAVALGMTMLFVGLLLFYLLYYKKKLQKGVNADV